MAMNECAGFSFVLLPQTDPKLIPNWFQADCKLIPSRSQIYTNLTPNSSQVYHKLNQHIYQHFSYIYQNIETKLVPNWRNLNITLIANSFQAYPKLTTSWQQTYSKTDFKLTPTGPSQTDSKPTAQLSLCPSTAPLKVISCNYSIVFATHVLISFRFVLVCFCSFRWLLHRWEIFIHSNGRGNLPTHSSVRRHPPYQFWVRPVIFCMGHRCDPWSKIGIDMREHKHGDGTLRIHWNPCNPWKPRNPMKP